MNNKKTGDSGEQDVVKLIKCPNCGKKLMLLPTNYPLYDVQCTACSFRAKVKTNKSKPKNDVFGAGWDIMSKVLKSGMMVPPLVVNFKLKEKNIKKQSILFFPFVPKSYLYHYKLSEKARRGGYKMFRYKGLLGLPHFELYKK